MNIAPRNNRSDEELAQQVRRQDRNAMKMLYDRYVGYLTAVCARYVPDDDDVKDILQEAFVKIFRTMGSFTWRGEGSLKAWMTHWAQS